MDLSISNFQSVDEIQRVIDKLQAARDRLVRGEQETQPTVSNNLPEPEGLTEETAQSLINDETLECLDDEDIIDVSALEEDEDISQWLVKTNNNVSIAELEADRSYMDTAMLNVQFSLVNLVKGYIFEQATKQMLQSPRHVLPKSVSSPTPKKLHNVSPPTHILHRRHSNSSDCSLPEPVLASSPISNTPKLELVDMFDLEDNLNRSNNFIGTPPRYVDSRTYTRPKKTRMSLDGHLQATGGGFNTLTLKHNSPLMSLHRQTDVYPNKNNNMNETYEVDDEKNSTFTKSDSLNEGDETALLNTTITLKPSTISPRNRQMIRNDSYIISKSPNSNVHDLNSTFVCATTDPSNTNNPNDSVSNLSMEELHVMARLQEQSLKDASPSRTLTRKETHVLMSFNNFDANLRPSRTSSTDTYSVGQSNPDSPGSSASGLSSPLDAQSYDNIQGAETFRRSMPDLASRRLSASAASGRALSLAPPINLLKSKPYHTSDTRLVHAGSNSRLSMLPTNGFGYNKNARNQSPDRSSSSSVETNNFLSMNRPRIGPTAPGSMNASLKHGQRTSSAPQPRCPTIVKPVIRPQSFLPPPGFSQTRPTSRIPAPGVGRGRLSRPSTAPNRQVMSNNKQPEWRDGCY